MTWVGSGQQWSQDADSVVARQQQQPRRNPLRLCDPHYGLPDPFLLPPWCVYLSLQFMTATEDVADEVASKLAGMDPKARTAAKAKAKVGGVLVWPVGGSIGVVLRQQQPETLLPEGAGGRGADGSSLTPASGGPEALWRSCCCDRSPAYLPCWLVCCAVRCCAVLHPQADMAEGMWVTDEFESEAYEMGNMETAWGMYLWDK